MKRSAFSHLLIQAVTVFFGLCCLAVPHVTFAQQSYNGGIYVQTFDSLVGSSWANDSTLKGWYATTTATATITSYVLSSGTGSTGALNSFGTSGSTDRALGYITTNGFTGNSGSGQGRIGLRLQNDTGSTLTSFTLIYDGEQWRREDTTAQSLVFDYKLGGTTFAAGDTSGYVAVSAANFSSPSVSAMATALDGNNDSYRSTKIITVTGITWTSGQSLWLRWSDINDSGSDHQLGIDNVRFAAGNSAVGNYLLSLSPEARNAGASGFTLTLRGVGFDANSKVVWVGKDENATTFGVGETYPINYTPPDQITVFVVDTLIATAGTAKVYVTNSGITNSPNSNAIVFTIGQVKLLLTIDAIALASGPKATFTIGIANKGSIPANGIQFDLNQTKLVWKSGGTSFGTATLFANGTVTPPASTNVTAGNKGIWALSFSKANITSGQKAVLTLQGTTSSGVKIGGIFQVTIP